MTKTTKDLKYDDNGNSIMADDSLFKANLLYYILQPFSDGGIIGRHKKILLITIMLLSGLLWMQIVRLYLSFDDIQQFMYTISGILIGQICMFKAYIIVANKDRLWNLLDITRFGFTTCSARNPSRLQQSRESLTFWIKTSTTIAVFSTVVWLLTPGFMKNVAFFKLDGTLGYHKATILNYWYPVSESMYNWLSIWFLIYVIEAFLVVLNELVIIMFDSYLVIMCIVLNAHFNTISAAYEMLGHRTSSRQSSDTSGIQVEIKDMESYYYDELIIYINDNTKLVKIFDEFYDIIRPSILIQVTVCVLSMITFIYIILLVFIMGHSTATLMIMQYVSAYLLVICQLSIYCYIFNVVDTAKSMLNSGLYGSNWTEMNLKFQKTLLLAMYMNSAHKRQLKFSPKLIVNLELFMAVMKFTYSIVSVLINVSIEKEART